MFVLLGLVALSLGLIGVAGDTPVTTRLAGDRSAQLSNTDRGVLHKDSVELVRQHGFKATSYVITGFIGWDAYMTWPMLKELDASGQIEIGAHTVDHADLKAMSAPRRAQEINGSKLALEEGLGHPVTAFCYPSGKYDAGVVALVRQAGFLTATTVEYGTKQSLQWAFELPRVRVSGPDSLNTWIGKLPK